MTAKVNLSRFHWKCADGDCAAGARDGVRASRTCTLGSIGIFNYIRPGLLKDLSLQGYFLRSLHVNHVRKSHKIVSHEF